MHKKIVLIAILLIAPAAFALNNRSAVSLNGVDTNPCTTIQPCRSFGAAVTNTAAGGEIIAVDTAGYGPFTVDRSLTVGGAPGIHAAITTAGDGIDIGGATAVSVTIHDLVLVESSPTPSSQQGIAMLGSGVLRVLNCSIRGFAVGVVTVQGALTVDHSTIVDNTVNGVHVLNNVGGGPVLATVSDSRFDGNHIGVFADQNTAVVINRSTISNSDAGGVLAESLGGSGSLAAIVSINASVVSYAGSAGVALSADGTNIAEAWLSDTLFAYNADALFNISQGVFHSFGNNEFAFNAGELPPLTLEAAR